MESLVVDLADILLANLPTVHEKLHFLELLSDARFTHRHNSLYSLAKMLHASNLSSHINIGTTLPDPHSVVSLFLSKEMYSEARKYARENAGGERVMQYNDEITIAQVENYIRKKSVSVLGHLFNMF